MVELIEIIKDLAAEVIIVCVFLWHQFVRDRVYMKHLDKRDETYDSRLGKMTDLFTETAKEGHLVAEKLGDALGELRVEIARGHTKGSKD